MDPVACQVQLPLVVKVAAGVVVGLAVGAAAGLWHTVAQEWVDRRPAVMRPSLAFKAVRLLLVWAVPLLLCLGLPLLLL